MKKSRYCLLFISIIISTILTVFSGCNKNSKENTKTSAFGKSLNIYTWDGMFPVDVLENFEKQTNVKINYTNFDSDEEMIAKLQESKGGDYDLIVADDYILEQIIKEDLATPLDKSKISNIGNVDELFKGQYYDKKDQYTIPYGAGVPLIVYNKDAVGFEITGYEDLWSDKLKNNLAIISNYRVVDGIALKSMGKSLNTQDISEIEKAGAKLLKLAPNIRIISDSNTHEGLLSGEVSAALLYTSQVNAALNSDPTLSICYPKEGLGFGVMAAFIPKNAPNKEAAYAFLNFILQPKVGAKCFENFGYFCTFKASQDYINSYLKERLILPKISKNSEIIENISHEAEDMHTKIWTEFKSKCE